MTTKQPSSPSWENVERLKHVFDVRVSRGKPVGLTKSVKKAMAVQRALEDGYSERPDSGIIDVRIIVWKDGHTTVNGAPLANMDEAAAAVMLHLAQVASTVAEPAKKAS